MTNARLKMSELENIIKDASTNLFFDAILGTSEQRDRGVLEEQRFHISQVLSKLRDNILSSQTYDDLIFLLNECIKD